MYVFSENAEIILLFDRPCFSDTGENQMITKQLIFGIVTGIDLLNFITARESTPAPEN